MMILKMIKIVMVNNKNNDNFLKLIYFEICKVKELNPRKE